MKMCYGPIITQLLSLSHKIWPSMIPMGQNETHILKVAMYTKETGDKFAEKIDKISVRLHRLLHRLSIENIIIKLRASSNHIQ